MDLLVSSFVYQFVPDRRAAFAEALRVLRPGGRLAFVTWLDRGPDFEPAVEFDEAVFDVEIEEPEEPEEEHRSGDFRSPRSAARELRDAGFKHVSAKDERLEYRWTIDSYLEFKERYEEESLFSGCRRKGRRAPITCPERSRHSHDAFSWRADIVSVVAERPK